MTISLKFQSIDERIDGAFEAEGYFNDHRKAVPLNSGITCSMKIPINQGKQ